MKYRANGAESPNISCADKKVKDTNTLDKYEKSALIPNALPRILLGNRSDTSSDTIGLRLKLNPANTPNSANVAAIFSMSNNFPSPCTEYASDSINNEKATNFKPSSIEYFLP